MRDRLGKKQPHHSHLRVGPVAGSPTIVVGLSKVISLYDVHFGRLAVPKGQRIVAIGLKVACAHILNVDRIPDDWSVQTTRAISGVEEFGANAGHGTSWLDDLKPLDGIMTVAISGDSPPCFSISGTLLTDDGDKERKLPIRFSDIRLIPRS